MKKPTRKTESTGRPKAKFTPKTGYGSATKRRSDSDESAPRSRRPTTSSSGYGAGSKRRSDTGDDKPTFRRAKPAADGGERPAFRRRSGDDADQPRLRRNTGAGDNSAVPRRTARSGAKVHDYDKSRRSNRADGDVFPAPSRSYGGYKGSSRPSDDERSGSARPRRARTDERDGTPRPRLNTNSRFRSEESPRNERSNNERSEKPRTARPVKRSDNEGGQRDTFRSRDQDRRSDDRRDYDRTGSRPVRRSTARPGDEEVRKPVRRVSPSARNEDDRRVTPKGRDDIKKNFQKESDRTPDYDFSRVEGKGKEKKSREDKDGTIRLNRYIANAGVCSRRDADLLIQSGEIKVNGTPVTEMGYQVKSNDVVKYGNRILNREKMVYVLLNKPKDFITTTDDPEERKTVMDLVSTASDGRLFPVGRLDRNTTGLLLLTNDGELSEKLTHPSYNISKIYEVHLDKPVTPEDYERVREGVELEDGKAVVDDLAIVTPDRAVLGIELHLGRNRIVRRIFEHLGYEVIKLDRVMYAGLNKKDLPRGKWRYLSEKEVIQLKYFL